MKRLLLLLTLGLVADGQVISTTDFQHIWEKVIAPVVSNPIFNTGTSATSLYVLLTARAGHSCLSPQTTDIGVEASFDNLAWSPVGDQVTLVTGSPLVAYVTAVGAYPFIRIAARNWNLVDCALTVYTAAAMVRYPIVRIVNYGSGGGGGGGGYSGFWWIDVINGNDSNNGTSQATAFRSLGPVPAVTGVQGIITCDGMTWQDISAQLQASLLVDLDSVVGNWDNERWYWDFPGVNPCGF